MTSSTARASSSSACQRAERSARDSSARRIGLPSATAIVVGNIVGAGVFTTSGFALADLGRADLVLLAWAIGGAIALCGALSYAALARQIPESGGEYTFLARNLHPLAGFLAGWVSLLAGFTAPIAVAALALEAYLTGIVALPLPAGSVGSSAIALAGLMHGLRLSIGARLQNAAVAVMLLAILAFVVAGIAGSGASLPLSSTAPARPPVPFALGPFAVTLVWISFSYAGWNAAVYVGGEVRDPERALPRAAVGGCGIVIALYLALNAVFVYSAPLEALAGRPDVGAVAAEALGGPALRRALAGVVVLALFTSISAMVMIGPRVYARMSEDGFFPRWLSRRGEAPGPAIALQSVLAIALVATSGLVELLGYIGFVLGLSSAATVASLVVLRRRLGASAVPVFGWPFVPALFVVATLATSLFLIVRAPGQALAGGATLALGLPVYLFFRRRAS